MKPEEAKSDDDYSGGGSGGGGGGGDDDDDDDDKRKMWGNINLFFFIQLNSYCSLRQIIIRTEYGSIY